MEEHVAWASREYFVLLAILLFARGMDFLSTWIATPNLELEANPLARRMGWMWGIPVNAAVCVLFAAWPLPSVIIATTSVLVAARNFQHAWLMRTAGEEGYRRWFLERMAETPPSLFLFCLFAQAFLIAGVGGVLVFFGSDQMVPFGIGLGMVAYAAAVVIYTLLALWRTRRSWK